MPEDGIWERGPWLAHFINEWRQLGGGYNWYTFNLIQFEVEMSYGFECSVVLLGFGFRIRRNSTREDPKANA